MYGVLTHYTMPSSPSSTKKKTGLIELCARLSLLAYRPPDEQTHPGCPPPTACQRGDALCYVWDVSALRLTTGVTTIVVFRGTDSLVDWKNNLDMKLVKLGMETLGRVHRGFHAQYARLSRAIGACLSNHPQVPSQRVCFTGHSLGGALATLASTEKGYTLSERPLCITFGSPRVGDGEFCQAFSERVRHSVRVSNAADPVCYVPMSPYRHVPARSLCVSPHPPAVIKLSEHHMSRYYLATVKRKLSRRMPAGCYNGIVPHIKARTPMRMTGPTACSLSLAFRI